MCNQIGYLILDFICFYLSPIKSGDLITFVAFILAIIAYRRSILDKYDSWKALLQSFLDELMAQSSWIGGIYIKNQDKEWFSPDKIVFKLSFESAVEIARRGISDSRVISKKLYRQISLFNERIVAFNQQLDYQMYNITANPILSGSLQDFLENNGLRKRAVLFPAFSLSVDNLSKSKIKIDRNMHYLAYRLYLTNDTIHNQLIGNQGQIDSLNYLYNSLYQEIFKKLEDYDKKIPFLLKKLVFISVITLLCILFLLIERYTR
ncbi:hypothetical protein M1271_04670 [Patescibacteria group bacterium]|nr:hypothetical protein [Patescibacteria group bacterium]